MLAWRPGELTRRYAHGERAKFISPLALFLFTVFVMFAVFSFVGADFGSATGIRQGIDNAVTEQQRVVANLRSQRAEAVSAGAAERTAQLDRGIAAEGEELTQLREIRERGLTTTILAEDSTVGPTNPFRAAYQKAKQNPELLFYKMQANGYKFSWALIPISLPFVWVLFLHRRRYRDELTLYDHLVFVTYSIAFMSLLLVTYVLLFTAGARSSLVNIAFMLVPPLHIYLQLRGAYRLAKFSAAWRTLALVIFANVAIILFLLLLVALGVLG